MTSPVLPLDRVTLHPVSATLAVDVEAVAAPDAADPDLRARIDAVWDAEKATRGERLFDGPVFHLAGVTPERLTLWPRSYRHDLASRRDPTLAAALGLRFVGVTGIVTCEGAVVLGRRADYLAADPGLWEPAPSGGLHRPDPTGVLLEELREELGLEAKMVDAPTPFALALDGHTGIVDICFRVPARLSIEALLARQRDHGTDEYAEVRAVPLPDLPAFVATHAGRMIEPLPEILRAAGLLGA